MTITMPAGLATALSFIGLSNFPEGDEDALHELKQAYDTASRTLSTAAGDVSRGADQLDDVIEGVVRDAMHDYFKEISGSPNGLEQVAKDFSTCGDLAGATATYVLLCKRLYIVQLEIFAAVLAVCIASAIETFGASMAAATADGIATRVALQTLVKKLCSEIATKVADTGAQAMIRAALEGAAKGAVVEGSKGALKSLGEQLMAQQYFGGPVDYEKVASAGAKDATTGALGGAVSGAGKRVIDGPAPFGPQEPPRTIRERLSANVADAGDRADQYRRYVSGEMSDQERQAFQNDFAAVKGPELADKASSNAAGATWDQVQGWIDGDRSQSAVSPTLQGPRMDSASVERTVTSGTSAGSQGGSAGSRPGAAPSDDGFGAQLPSGAGKDPGFGSHAPGFGGQPDVTPPGGQLDDQGYRYVPLAGETTEAVPSASGGGENGAAAAGLAGDAPAGAVEGPTDDGHSSSRLNLDTS